MPNKDQHYPQKHVKNAIMITFGKGACFSCMLSNNHKRWLHDCMYHVRHVMKAAYPTTSFNHLSAGRKYELLPSLLTVSILMARITWKAKIQIKECRRLRIESMSCTKSLEKSEKKNFFKKVFYVNICEKENTVTTWLEYSIGNVLEVILSPF